MKVQNKTTKNAENNICVVFYHDKVKGYFHQVFDTVCLTVSVLCLTLSLFEIFKYNIFFLTIYI